MLFSRHIQRIITSHAMSKIKSHSGWFMPVIPAFRKLMLECGPLWREREDGRGQEGKVGSTVRLQTEERQKRKPTIHPRMHKVNREQRQMTMTNCGKRNQTGLLGEVTFEPWPGWWIGVLRKINEEIGKILGYMEH